MNNLEHEIKQFIIDSLNLEDIKPEDINSKEPLFVEGLGLDSIDALELGVALKKKYNITLDPDDDSTRNHFESVNTLVELVNCHRGK